MDCVAPSEVRFDMSGLNGPIRTEGTRVWPLSSVDSQVPLELRGLGENFATNSTHERTRGPGGLGSGSDQPVRPDTAAMTHLEEREGTSPHHTSCYFRMPFKPNHTLIWLPSTLLAVPPCPLRAP